MCCKKNRNIGKSLRNFLGAWSWRRCGNQVFKESKFNRSGKTPKNTMDILIEHEKKYKVAEMVEGVKEKERKPDKGWGGRGHY